ncbi:coenzyme PQQ synthesis protein E [Longimycelium tulufanense]|uniref:PqqA peptide cyclase n=1 Tax=Longimycelium tulufanense TaxID=907463 RepID=A0A8J3C987_9PSEU|nr:pyrroloquinoline quinone biosynthesis protein PqqE [Longimycelium tulufanense]GGM33856.1 coenzyme PQQ synthesis protein E [Longimycelium tulufanense]
MPDLHARPLGLLAELTHRCPLHCPYCSNPLELVTRERELDTTRWCSVLDQARELGVLQVHFSGGEPLARRDLPALVSHAHGLGCYTNLVTSGVGLTGAVIADLAERGVDHVQLSVQDANEVSANRIGGARTHEHKLTAARVVKERGLPLSVNVVLHRHNHDNLASIIALAEEMGADRLELANTQYYGWALRNRTALMPTQDQLDAAQPVVRAAQQRLSGRMEIIYVIADYHEAYPKPCMHGWGARQITVAPDGTVLPCLAATVIPDLRLSNVTDHDLAWIWYDSPSFNAFRGVEWMREPCRSCSRRFTDFGGCRCQAFLLTGDAANTDPVCSLSPHRTLVDQALSDIPERSPTPVMRAVAGQRVREWVEP